MRSDIAEIRDRVARLRAALLSPGVEAIEGCIPGLEEAAQRLTQILKDLVESSDLSAQDRLELRSPLLDLQQDLWRAQSLAAGGAAFWQGWGRFLGVAADADASYTAQGAGGTVAEDSRLDVNG